LDGLHLLGLNESGLTAHPLVVRADAYFESQSQVMADQYSLFDEASLSTLHTCFVKALGGKIPQPNHEPIIKSLKKI
jgi:hypothetical protein